MVNLHIIYGAELINLQMEYHDKVRDIKEQIKTSTHIPVASQRLSLGNLELEDGRSIRGYSNIHDGTTLHLVFEQGDSPKRGVLSWLFQDQKIIQIVLRR